MVGGILERMGGEFLDPSSSLPAETSKGKEPRTDLLVSFRSRSKRQGKDHDLLGFRLSSGTQHSHVSDELPERALRGNGQGPELGGSGGGLDPTWSVDASSFPSSQPLETTLTLFSVSAFTLTEKIEELPPRPAFQPGEATQKIDRERAKIKKRLATKQALEVLRDELYLGEWDG